MGRAFRQLVVSVAFAALLITGLSKCNAGLNLTGYQQGQAAITAATPTPAAAFKLPDLFNFLKGR